ncbi:DNA polymerase iota isoform X2 [Phyllopteryx taeniolatus]|uniref:DNA polymerase iota isoform X2 n=1 Tax=Phyllopteryx taeniolatus TaxID=161469 RepID=UPI002AD4D1C7|nr:DNA polymerase iota isoform X2 [Phyllopteryx taeniolatus]
MESSEDDIKEDETEWKQHLMDSPLTRRVSGSSPNKTPAPAHKVILHFDLDCFYAQVEMIRNPTLRDVPLGIQQKYIIVTCNYVARQQGVTKLMSVTNAREKCPQLVLVKGEDLTHYREMSYQVTDLLLSFCPLVERLGFDENFVDITEMIANRLPCTPDFSFEGHVYSTSTSSDDDAPAVLLSLAMNLFSKMVDTAAPFHLTLINVCFSNLPTQTPAATTRGSITSFFAPSTSPQTSTQSQIDSSMSGSGADDRLGSPSIMTPLTPENTAESTPGRDAASRQARHTRSASVSAEASQPVTTSHSSTCSYGGDSQISVTHRLPPNVDPQVFSELPANLQMELMREWEQRRPVLKIPAASRKPGREAKDKKGSGTGSQANSATRLW